MGKEDSDACICNNYGCLYDCYRLPQFSQQSNYELMTGFEEAGSGAVFALLPHVHPTFNGKSWLISKLS